MEKKQLMDLAYWIMIVLVIATCIFVILYLRSNANQCLTDPLKYYSNKIGEECFCVGNFLK